MRSVLWRRSRAATRSHKTMKVAHWPPPPISRPASPSISACATALCVPRRTSSRQIATMPKPNATISFEARLGRLEAIVHELEGDQIELARALELFEEGVECLRAASKELADARSKVQRLVERDDGSFELTDFRG